MKKTLFTILLALSIFGPVSAHALSVSWDRPAVGRINPLYVLDTVFGNIFTATSTTQASTFPYASTTVTSANTFCLGTDCRTSWPTGTVTSVSNSDSSLTFSPTTGNVVGSLNTAHSNTWSVAQTFFNTALQGYSSGGGSNDALKFVSNNAGASIGVQNTNSSGFAGIEYIDNGGSVSVFTGYNNGSPGEFRFNNIASGGHINFKIGGIDALVVNNDKTIAFSQYGSGLAKLTSGTLGLATAGTDYAPATSGTSILYGNGSGGFSNVTVGTGLSFTGGTLSTTGGGGGSGNVATSSAETSGYFAPWSSTAATPATLAGTSQIFQNGTDVNIGTTTASGNQLDIANTSGGATAKLTGNSTTVSTSLTLNDLTTAGNQFVGLLNPSGASGANATTKPLAAVFFSGTGATNGLSFISRASNSPINFYAGGPSLTTNLALTLLGTNQNVGVSTSTPYAKLSVGGDTVIGASTAGGTLGDLYVPKLGTAAGTFVAADPSGKLIATTTPSSSSGTVTNIATTWPISGGPITTTGTISYVGLSTSSPIVSGQGIYATGVSTIASIATSTPSTGGPITYSGTFGSLFGGTSGSFGCTAANGSTNGCLSSGDWTTFNNKISSSSLSATSPITYSPSTGVIACPTCATSTGITALGSGWATTTGSTITFSTSTLSFNGLTFGQTIVPSTSGLLFTPTVTGTLNNAGLTNSTVTVNGTSIALGASGTITAASSTLLSDTNTWSGRQNFSNATSSLFTVSSAWWVPQTSSLLLTDSTGKVGSYAGASCTNQFVRSLNGAGAATCATVQNTDLANSSISFTSSDSSLTVPASIALGSSGSFTLNLAHANTWSALQTLNGGASSTGELSMQTSSSTFAYVSGLGTAAGTFVAADPSGKLIATTTPSGSSNLGTNALPSGSTFVVASRSNASGSTYYTLYTVPAGKRAYVKALGTYNTTGSPILSQISRLATDGSTYQRLSSAVSVAGNSIGNPAPNITLYAGESLVASSSATGLNYTATLVLMPSSAPYITASTSISSANTLTTLYTAGASESDFESAPLFSTGALTCHNSGASAASAAVYLTPSGGTPYQLSGTSSISSNLASNLGNPPFVGLSPGDTVSIISSLNTVFCFLTLVSNG